MRKEQIKSIDFIKTICALGVFLVHFEDHYAARPLYFFGRYFNGGMLVTVFFIVSGGLLWYHYSDNLELKRYYVKRWKGIFPMYYIAFIPVWLINVVRHGSFLYEGPAYAYVYTLLGMDGYLAFTTETYHIVGEWFLGAIIVMYLLFPMIRWSFHKNKWALVAGTVLLYMVFYDKPITNTSGFWTISSCLVSFCLGLLFMEYRKSIISLPGVLVAAMGYVLLCVVGVSLPHNALWHILGACMFILLFALGEIVMERPWVNRLFRELSRLSYPVFLTHHVILQVFLMIWQPTVWWQIGLYAVLIIVVVLFVSQMLAMITKFVMKELGKCCAKGISAKNGLEQ